MGGKSGTCLWCGNMGLPSEDSARLICRAPPPIAPDATPVRRSIRDAEAAGLDDACISILLGPLLGVFFLTRLSTYRNRYRIKNPSRRFLLGFGLSVFCLWSINRRSPTIVDKSPL